jgi:hypothetical protein
VEKDVHRRVAGGPDAAAIQSAHKKGAHVQAVGGGQGVAGLALTGTHDLILGEVTVSRRSRLAR